MPDLVAMNDLAAEVARSNNTAPLRVTDPKRMPFKDIPHLGISCGDWDEEYERLDKLFVDSTGFGEEAEPALTVWEFLERLTELIAEHGDLYVALEDVGQFQAWVVVWAGK